MAKSEKEVNGLDDALDQISDQFGKGAIMFLGGSKVADAVAAISTGNTGIDKITGIGGIPKGRVTEIYGPEGGGKTTLALQIIAQSQKSGGLCAFIDAEHALDPAYAKALGIDIDKLLISQPSNGEEALTIAEMLIRSGAVSVVVIDSVAALVPKAELEGEMGEPQMGLQARLMSQAMRKLTGLVAKTKVGDSLGALIFINQIRDKIGIMFGNPETTTGGRALKFYSSLRLDVRRTSSIKKGDKVIGNDVKVKTVKNKHSAPYRDTTESLLFGRGFIDE